MNNDTEKRPTNIEKFFRELSRRMYKENDLSDMVYALCRSNPGFMQFFLDFIFGAGNLVASDFRVEREVFFDNGRPDFVLTKKDNEERYFVEVKIGDRNHHFSQYCSELDRLNKEKNSVPHLGYITNYEIKKDELAEDDKTAFEECKAYCHTWSEFKDALSKTSQIATLGEDVKGLLAYCDMVCPTSFEDEQIKDYTHDVEKFIAICNWYNCLEEFLNSKDLVTCVSEHQIKIGKYRVANTPAESIGIYFEAVDVTENMDDGKKMCAGKKIWGWAGWLLTKGFHPGFCIAFDNIEGWGAPVFKSLNKPDESWLPFCCDFTTNEFSFQNAFEAVFAQIIKGEYPEENATRRDVDDSFYAARALPLYLRQQVIPMLSCTDCIIEPFQQKDSFNPKGWCGEYFAVRTNPKNSGEGKPVGIYWIGTYFDGNKSRKDISSASIDSGEIVCEKIGGGIIKLLDVKKSVETVETKELVGKINEFIKPSKQ